MKHLVISLLIFTSTSLLAQQWTPIATSVDGTVSNLDLATLRKEGDIRRVWVLENFSEKKPSMFLSDSSGVFSIRYRMEYDCKNERHKTLSYTFFTEKEAKGTVSSKSDLPSNWVDIAPGTAAWKLMETACKTKLP
jgi:hypothetical protein